MLICCWIQTVAYLPVKIGEEGVRDTVEVMRRVALQKAVDELQRKVSA